MKLSSNSLVYMAIAIEFFSLVSISSAQTSSSISPTVVFTTDAQNPAITGVSNVDSGDPSDSADLYVRERLNPSQNDRRISSFLNFDVSVLTLADIDQPGFAVSFTADYDFQLNNSNTGAAAVVGRVTNGAWNGTSTRRLE